MLFTYHTCLLFNIKIKYTTATLHWCKSLLECISKEDFWKWIYVVNTYSWSCVLQGVTDHSVKVYTTNHCRFEWQGTLLFIGGICLKNVYYNGYIARNIGGHCWQKCMAHLSVVKCLINYISLLKLMDDNVCNASHITQLWAIYVIKIKFIYKQAM